MNCIGLLAGALILVLLAAGAVAQDPGKSLNPGDPLADTVSQDTENAMSVEDLFNPAQDQRGTATPVMTGKNVAEAVVNQQPSQPKTRLLSPSNKWHLDLQDTSDRVADLEMYQSNDVVFGRGTIAVEGKAQNVSATGTVAGNKLNLDVLTEDLSLFRLVLTMNGKSIYGDYHIYSASFVPGKGIAMGKVN